MARPSWESSLLGAADAKFSAEKRRRQKIRRSRPAVELALRCALSAPPYGLRRASLRASSTNNNETANAKPKKGDISILVRRGTFLFCFDIPVSYACASQEKMMILFTPISYFEWTDQ